MKEKILKKSLLVVYAFCLVFTVTFVVNYYKEEKTRLLNIEKSLGIEKVGTKVKLELNDKNKDEDVIYEVKDSSVVKVNEKGELISVGEGTTTVTVTNKEKTKSQTIVVSVGKEAIDKVNKDKDKVDELIKENSTPTKEPDKPGTNTGSNSNSNTNTGSNNNSNTNTGSNSNSNTNTGSNNNSNTNTGSNSNSNTNTGSNNNSNTNTGSNNNSNTNTGSNNSTNKPSSNVVSVTGITLNKSNVTSYLNTATTDYLTATISPSNATNKKVTWSTSNSSVATVDSNGKVYFIKPGVVTISAKTQDGNKVATTTYTIKQKLVFVIGASQVTRMDWYTSVFTYNYKKYEKNISLFYIHNSGTGFSWQTGEGMTTANKKITSYASVKNYVEIYIYFPLIGNSIKNFVCGDKSHPDSLGKTSDTNGNIKDYAKQYNTAIQNLKNNGYNVKGYVVSMHPVKVSQADNDKIVTNSNANACAYGYRSNWKYYRFNISMRHIVEASYSKNLKYIPLFTQIMQTNNEGANFDFKITYNTTDGVHWDSPTTNTYVNMMLKYSGELQ